MIHSKDGWKGENATGHITPEAGGTGGWGSRGAERKSSRAARAEAELDLLGGGWKEQRDQGFLSSNNSHDTADSVAMRPLVEERHWAGSQGTRLAPSWNWFCDSGWVTEPPQVSISLSVKCR